MMLMLILPRADIIAQRIDRAVSSQETLNATVAEAIVDLSVERLGDTHQKVCLAALSALLSLLSRAEFATQIKSRLGAAVLALFSSTSTHAVDLLLLLLLLFPLLGQNWNLFPI